MKLNEYLKLELSRFNSIIRDQIKYLESIRKCEVATFLDRGISTGSGDSHAASLYAQLLSNHTFLSADPYELRLSPPSGKGTLISISVKGRTREVVEASKILKRRGWHVLSLTSDTSSPLARVSDKVIRVVYGGGELPVGIGNFISVITAITWMFKGAKGVRYDVTAGNTDIQELGEFSEIVTVGEGVGDVSAYFACLKFHETLCMPCRHYSIEQFLHADIYSLRKDSLTLIFPGLVKEKSALLNEILDRVGTPHYVLSVDSSSNFNAVVSGVIEAVNIIIKLVERKSIDDPCFMTRKALLDLSTPVIYGVK